MSVRIGPVPSSPDFRVEWDQLDQTYDWIRDLKDCLQDPEYHAEGDVWIHTRMAAQALTTDSRWRALPDAERELLFGAILLHDVGKPDCTRPGPDGRLTSRGHSKRGELLARQILYRLGSSFAQREAIARMIRAHQVPFHFIDKEDPKRAVIELSTALRCDHLSILATADSKGRVCHNAAETAQHLEAFDEYCREQGCWSEPYPFPSDHSRFLYLRGAASPDYRPHEEFRCQVILMSGFPGAGKDYWIQKNCPDWPVVSLDELRKELKVAPTEDQGPVVAAAREHARQYLRDKRSFVWNATNLSRMIRGQSLDLFADYNAHIRIVYVEVPQHQLFQQNRRRSRPVPEHVLVELQDRWEVPELTEAHLVDYVVVEAEE